MVFSPIPFIPGILSEESPTKDLYNEKLIG
jgi:hypothetical protein